jgi:SAM-dependent methyltransferase
VSISKLQDYSQMITVLSSLAKSAEVEDLLQSFPSSRDAVELGNLFDRHGSDKARFHNYHFLYSSLLTGRRNDALCILEIGMWHGGSLRAFRDFGKRYSIFGVDKEECFLFQEERIQTFLGDQTKPETLVQLTSGLPRFDLIVDDGLHRPWAALNTIAALIAHLKPNGYLVVEDIDSDDLALWNVSLSILSQSFKCNLYQAARGFVLVIQAT